MLKLNWCGSMLHNRFFFFFWLWFLLGNNNFDCQSTNIGGVNSLNYYFSNQQGQKQLHLGWGFFFFFYTNCSLGCKKEEDYFICKYLMVC